MDTNSLDDNLFRIAKAISHQFGKGCETVVHDVSGKKEARIIFIENGQVTGRRLGDCASEIALKAQAHKNEKLADSEVYFSTTDNARILRSNTVFIYENEQISRVFSINFDLTDLILAQTALRDFTGVHRDQNQKKTQIPKGVTELLERLLQESVEHIGKPVAIMKKEDKKRAINFLNDAGAFLITKSGERIAAFFGVSKYTLYNYIDTKQEV